MIGHSFKVHKGGKNEPEDEDAVVRSTKLIGKDRKSRRILAKGPLGEVWCDVTCDNDGPLPGVVSDTGTWIKVKDGDAFMVKRYRKAGPDRGAGYVTSLVDESKPMDSLSFVYAYVRFVYEEVELGATGKADWQ